MRRTPVLILGGGPAGSAAAITLAQGGQRALVLERARTPGDALCGGFLSWRTLEALGRLGIEADSLNTARVTRLRLFAGRHVAEARLPAPAIGVSRRRLDALLLAKAEAAGAAIERGVTVREVDGRVARLADGGDITGDAVLLATGKHDVRGAARDAALAADPTLGLRLRLRAAPAIGDAIELHLFDGGYAGVVVQEDGCANLCMAVARSRLQVAGDPRALLVELARDHPALANRLDAIESTTAIDAVANVPYGWRAQTTEPGIFRLGDQAAVIPSLAGEGMGIAIASGTLAARALRDGVPAHDFQRHFAARAARPLAVAGLIWRLAEHQATASALARLAHAPWLVRAVASLTRIKQSTVDDAA